MYEDLAERKKTEKSNWDQKLDLIQGFGAGKKKREMASMIAGKVTDDKIEDMADVKDTIAKRGDNLGMSKEGADAGATELKMMRELLPEFDIEATVPALVYKKDKLCPDNILNLVDGSYYGSLVSDKKKFAKESPTMSYDMVRSLCILFHEHTESSTSSIRRNGKSLQMLEWLIDLYRFCFMKPTVDENGKRGATGKDCIPHGLAMLKAFDHRQKMPPPELCQYWLAQFKEAGASKKIHRKKLLCYIAVWAVVQTPGYKCELNLLTADIDDTTDKFVTRTADYIGCERRITVEWRLRAPLEVPEIRNKKNSKRKR